MTNPLSGWLNLYKPKHISSAKFIAKVKYLVKPAKVGHAGTLDPLAEGILPVAIGEATKLTSYLMDAKKIYAFTIQFGARTNSSDEGTEIVERTENKVTQEDLESVIPKFIGAIRQVPSKYSAIKINGERAYNLARNDIEFEMKEREVNIYNLSLESFDPLAQQASLVCECSKGTYIRTLAEDIAFSLQNLGYVIRLARLKVGKFDAETSIKLDHRVKANQDDGKENDCRAALQSSLYVRSEGQEVRHSQRLIGEDYNLEAFSLDTLKQKLLPVDFMLDDILVIDALEDVAKKIRFGQKVIFEDKQDGFYSIYSNGILLAIGNLLNGSFEIKRLFNLPYS